MPTTVFSDSRLNSSSLHNWCPQSAYFSLGNASSADSSCSSISSSSPVHDDDNSIQIDMNSPEYCDGPYLQILEQPFHKFRFRYKTEMQGTHGAILGAASGQKSKEKSFPVVQLCNYFPKESREIIIRCMLYTADEDESKRVPHVHRLVCKSKSGVSEDPHDVVVNAPSYLAEFKNMTILFTKKEDQERVLSEKKVRHLNSTFSSVSNNPFPINQERLRRQVLEDLGKMQVNKACLRFDAFFDNGTCYTRIGKPVYSQEIQNSKHAEFNDLKICRSDKYAGSCEGNEEMLIFVEKVMKKNIRVRFFQEGPNKEVLWQDYAQFNDDDVHHQYAIALRTPPYRNRNLTETVEVKYQLERPSDRATSEPLEFVYCPNPNRRREIHRKRPRLEPITLPTVISEYNTKPTSVFQSITSDDIPLLDDVMDVLTDIERADQRELPNPDFNKIMDSLPTPNADAVKQLLHSEHFDDYLLCLGLDGSLASLKSMGSQPRDNVPDGICNTSATRQHLLDMTKSTELQSGVNKSQENAGDQATITPSRRLSSLPALNENNIVDKLNKALDVLILLRQKMKITTQMFNKYLSHLFTYVVKDSEDTVFHILAASTRNADLLTTIKFINFLKTTNNMRSTVNRRNKYMETPLLVAAEMGSPEMISALLEAEADVNDVDLKQNTAMHRAMLRETDSLAIMSALLPKCPNITFNRDGYTVLHLAVLNRKSDAISSLLMKAEEKVITECIVNIQDKKRGNTALHMAVENRHVEVVKLLINFEKRIDLFKINYDGKSALDYAYEGKDELSMAIAKMINVCSEKTRSDTNRVPKMKRESIIKQQGEESRNKAAESEVIEVLDDDDDLLYGQEWENLKMNMYRRVKFDKETIETICPLLDQNNNWKVLFNEFKFTKTELDMCRQHFSPSLHALHISEVTRPYITTQSIRDMMATSGPRFISIYPHIDRMLSRQK